MSSAGRIPAQRQPLAGPVSSSLAAWVSEEIGATPVKQLFVRQGNSVSVAWRLSNGQCVVVKARHESIARASACLTLQTGLFAQRYPATRPLTEAAIVDGLTVHAEDYVDGGDQLLGDDHGLARPYAEQLAVLVNRLEQLQPLVDLSALTPPPWVSWWSTRPWTPQPVVPDLVYAAAARVRERLSEVELPGVIGHAAWTSRNLRWAAGRRLHAVYDWESLGWMPEAVVAGVAGAIFPTERRPELASLQGTMAFLEHYQRARGRSFTDVELEIAWAAGLLPVLFSAREEAVLGRRPLVLEHLPEQCERRLRLACA